MLIKIWFCNYHVTRRKDFHRLFFNIYLKDKYPQHEILISKNNPDIVFCSVFQPSDINQVVGPYPNALKVFYTPENIYRTPMFKRVYDGAVNHKFDYFIDFNQKGPNVGEQHARIPFWYFDRDYFKRDQSKDLAAVNQNTTLRAVDPTDLKFASLISRKDRFKYRSNILSKLNQIKQVDCPSIVGKNCPSVEEQGLTKTQFISKYIFNICPENTYHEGYVTEKIFDAMIGGCIPIFWGGMTSEKSIINTDKMILVDPTNEESLEKLKTHVSDLLNSPEKLTELLKMPGFKPNAVEEINKYSDQLDAMMNNMVNTVKTRQLLKGLPTVYWINLERSEERRNKMLNNFKKYQIKNTRVEGFDGKNNDFPDWFIPNKKNAKLELCITISHFKAIKQFIESGQELGFIAEDDLSFKYSDYWQQSLMEIANSLPSDWEVFQMSLVLTTASGLEKHINNEGLFMHRERYQFGATAYLITKAGAKRLVELYEREEDGKTILDLSKPKTFNPKIFRSDSENIVFGSLKTYCMRLPYFTYNDCEIGDSVHQNSEGAMFMRCKERLEAEWKKN